MNQKKNIFQRVIHGNELSHEVLPVAPLVEIIGDERVLIENHICVVSYDTSKVCVRVKYGTVFVQGEQLHLTYMSIEKLIITGSINSVQLHNTY